MSDLRKLLLCIWLLYGLSSCDTESNVDLPADTHFLKFFGRDGNQSGVDIAVAPDGTILLLGTTEIVGGADQLYLVNCDANGNLLWERTYGNPDKKNEARDMELTDDGRIVLAANEENVPGERDVYFLAVDLTGSPLDSIRISLLDTAGNAFDESVNSITKIGSEFLVTGSTTNLGIKPSATGTSDVRDAFLFRFNDDLTLFDPDLINGVWNTTLGFNSDDVGIKIYPGAPGNFYLFGYSNKEVSSGITGYNFWIQEIGATGETLAELTTNPINGSNRLLSSVIISPAFSGAGFVMAGVSQTASGTDIYLAKSSDQIVFNLGTLNERPVSSVGDITDQRVSAAASSSSGYLVAANVSIQGNQNIFLTKINADLSPLWTNYLEFGGPENDDSVGAIAELPDGRIIIVGTMRTGDDAEQKMVLMKLSPEGRFEK